MSKFIKTAEDIKVVAKKFQGFMELASALEEVGKLEQTAKEMAMLKDKAKEDLEKVNAEVLSAKAKLDEAELAVKFSEQKASKLVEAANNKASSIIESALNKAKDIDADLEKKKEALDEKFYSAGKELSAIEQAVLAKKQELESVKKEIDLVKQKVASFLK